MINISIRLHDYLRKISKQKKSEWPVYLNKFLNEYGIKKYNLIDSIAVVHKVMSEYWFCMSIWAGNCPTLKDCLRAVYGAVRNELKEIEKIQAL